MRLSKCVVQLALAFFASFPSHWLLAQFHKSTLPLCKYKYILYFSKNQLPSPLFADLFLLFSFLGGNPIMCTPRCIISIFRYTFSQSHFSHQLGKYIYNRGNLIHFFKHVLLYHSCSWPGKNQTHIIIRYVDIHPQTTGRHTVVSMNATHRLDKL